MNPLTLGDLRVLKFAVSAMEFNVRKRGPLGDQSTFETVAAKIKGRGPGGLINFSRQEALCASALLPALATMLFLDPRGEMLFRDRFSIDPPSQDEIKATREKMEAWIREMPLH